MPTYRDFEDFLAFKFAREETHILDDDFVDAFIDWQGELEPEDWIKFGNEYRAAQTLAIVPTTDDDWIEEYNKAFRRGYEGILSEKMIKEAVSWQIAFIQEHVINKFGQPKGVTVEQLKTIIRCSTLAGYAENKEWCDELADDIQHHFVDANKMLFDEIIQLKKDKRDLESHLESLRGKTKEAVDLMDCTDESSPLSD